MDAEHSEPEVTEQKMCTFEASKHTVIQLISKIKEKIKETPSMRQALKKQRNLQKYSFNQSSKINYSFS